MFKHSFAAPIGLGLLVIAGCTPQSQVAQTDAPRDAASALPPEMARVWFFRQTDNPLAGNVYGASPIIYANGAPVGEIPQGTAFYHDFLPGKYRFTVQPYGTPTREHDTLQLAPGMQSYVQVQWEANWEANRTGGGASFTVTTSSPEIAQQYIPLLTNLGGR